MTFYQGYYSLNLFLPQLLLSEDVTMILKFMLKAQEETNFFVSPVFTATWQWLQKYLETSRK